MEPNIGNERRQVPWKLVFAAVSLLRAYSDDSASSEDSSRNLDVMLDALADACQTPGEPA